MEKVYLDRTEIPGNVAIIFRNAEVIQAGATVYSMSVREKSDEYRRFADEYDIHFIFDDEIPQVAFYTIPQADIFAIDSNGGYFASVGGAFDMEQPVCYIDRNKNCFLLAEGGTQFVENAPNWKSMLNAWDGIALYDSKESAGKDYKLFGKSNLEGLRKEAMKNREIE